MTDAVLDPTAELWTAARAGVARMCRVMGVGALIAARGIARSQTRYLRQWLFAIEVFVRKILVIEARRVFVPPPRCKAQKPNQAPAPAPEKEKEKEKPARAPSYAFKLWSTPKPHPARIRLLGPPTHLREIWRERRRAALLARLKRAGKRAPAHTLLARRMLALQRLLEKPESAILRLARKLKRRPRLAGRLAMATPIYTAFIDRDASGRATRESFAAAQAFYVDSS